MKSKNLKKASFRGVEFQYEELEPTDIEKYNRQSDYGLTREEIVKNRLKQSKGRVMGPGAVNENE